MSSPGTSQLQQSAVGQAQIGTTMNTPQGTEEVTKRTMKDCTAGVRVYRSGLDSGAL